jgi:hypothetical protein
MVQDMQKVHVVTLECFGLFGKYRIRRFKRYLQKGKRASGRHSTPVSRQQMCHNGHNAFRKAYGNLGGKWEMGRKASDGL